MDSQKKSSRISGFYKLPIKERLSIIAEKADLTTEETALLVSGGGLDMDVADRMIENVIGSISYPMGLAVNFRIDGVDRLIPMVGEEPSVVAAASNMARLMREGDGITITRTDPVMIGQIQILELPDRDAAIK